MTDHLTLTQDEWKAKCQASFHVRPGDKLTFTEANNRGVIGCWIEGTSVYLGSYFIKDDRNFHQAGTGWLHT